jgi:alpha-glucosidase
MHNNGVVDNYPSVLVSHTVDKNVFHFYSENQVVLKIEVISDSIIRVRCGTEGTLEEDFSYAIDKNYVDGDNIYDRNQNGQMLHK